MVIRLYVNDLQPILGSDYLMYVDHLNARVEICIEKDVAAFKISLNAPHT